VLIFKSLERCSNREAARNVRFRTDWQYALHLPLDYAGFDQNVIAEFRHRLLANGIESRIFNAIFKELRDLGYYKPRGIQHTDSIAIHTHCRDLRRIELMVETLRKAVHDLLRAAPDWTRATLPGVWEERYAQSCKSERMKEEDRQALAVTAGDDGQWLLDRLEQDDAGALRELDAVERLRSGDPRLHRYTRRLAAPHQVVNLGYDLAQLAPQLGDQIPPGDQGTATHRAAHLSDLRLRTLGDVYIGGVARHQGDHLGQLRIVLGPIHRQARPLAALCCLQRRPLRHQRPQRRQAS
jgi:hypothetical protein